MIDESAEGRETCAEGWRAGLNWMERGKARVNKVWKNRSKLKVAARTGTTRKEILPFSPGPKALPVHACEMSRLPQP